MGRRRQLGLLVLAAVALFLPAGLHAQAVADGTVSVIHVPLAPSGTRVEWAVADGWSNDWEVSVAFDAEHCDVYCAIRRKRDTLGRVPAMDLLLPPVVAVQIFSDSVSEPLTVIVDPSGRTSPAARTHTPGCDDSTCTSGERGFAISLAAAFQRREHHPEHRNAAAVCTASAVTTQLPLRV